ncbi:MAG: membrane protein insertion efficiency factor YidD [bacterium]|nr:membrane protein insertion efficiency factor YidD [bacterium]
MGQIVLIALVRLYQRAISPFMGPACRYYPSCSEYAVATIRQDGVLRGGWRAMRRLGRCHPFAGGGLDLP